MKCGQDPSTDGNGLGDTLTSDPGSLGRALLRGLSPLPETQRPPSPGPQAYVVSSVYLVSML